jgi:hypothetical protein
MRGNAASRATYHHRRLGESQKARLRRGFADLRRYESPFLSDPDWSASGVAAACSDSDLR